MSKSPPSTLNGIRVLVLEDEFLLADDLARCLEDAGAETIGPVNTVEQAEKLLEVDLPDAAIVDLNLRGEMASGFIERLAATRLPCLIVSGYGDDAVPQSVNRVPRLEKPVSPAAVIERLAAELVRRA